MSPRTLAIQNQIRSTTSGVEYDDTLNLALAEVLVNEAFLSDPTQVSGTLVMDLNFLRTTVRDIKGASPFFNWFDPAGSTPGLITLSGARAGISNLQTFTGSNNDDDTTPDYTSTIFITQNVSLEQAISELDAALVAVSGSQQISKAKLIRTGSSVVKDTTIDISTPGAGWTVTGDTIVWTDAADFVENVSVFHNGILQLPASSAVDNNDVYFVSTPDSLAFEFNIRTNDVIQVWKFPSV
jgi:hypothetical protein